MPELPELEVIKENLLVQIKGKKISSLRILKPYVLKDFFKGNLANESINDISRRGKYLIFETDAHRIIVHLMLHGSLTFALPSSKAKNRVPLCYPLRMVQYSNSTSGVLKRGCQST